MEQGKRIERSYEQVFFSAIILLILNWAFNAWMTGGARVFYLDDLEAYNGYINYKEESGIWSYLINTEGGKFRVVMNAFTILLYELIGTNFEWLDTVLLLLNWINGITVYAIIRKICGNSKYKNEVSCIGASIFLISRFAYYNITEFFGIMEGTGILFSLLVLYFLLCYLKKDLNGKKELLCANICYLIVMYIHERYVLLVGVFVIAVICKNKKYVKKWIEMILPLSLFIFFWLIRYFLLGTSALSGTGGQAINDTFNFKQAIGFAFSQVGYILGINCGPKYLNGVNFKDVPKWINVIIIVVIAITIIILIKNIKNRKNSLLKMEDTLVFFSFIGCCIVSSSTTIRVEMRWIYVSYAAFVIFLSVCYMDVLNKSKSKIWIVVGGIYVCMSFGLENYYRSNYENIYYWDIKNASKSLYEHTIGRYSDSFTDRTTVLITEKDLTWNEEEWKDFFRPYLDTTNLHMQCVSTFGAAAAVANMEDIVLAYDGKEYMDVSDKIRGYSYQQGHYEDGWVEKNVKIAVDIQGNGKLVIDCCAYDVQSLEVEIDGVARKEKIDLEVGQNCIEIELKGGSHMVELKSNFEKQLSEVDIRKCSYLIGSIKIV